MISIVTAWLDHPELIADYEAAVQGAEVIIIDNGSTPENNLLLAEMVTRLGGKLITNAQNAWFSGANNQGYQMATGGVIMFLNNDIKAPAGWLGQVWRDTLPGYLVGAAGALQVACGQPMLYIEGHCVAATRETWSRLRRIKDIVDTRGPGEPGLAYGISFQAGPWDADTYPQPYCEDVDLSWRARQLGIKLRVAQWPLTHLSNTTSRHTPGAYDASKRNKATFEARVRAAQE